MDILVGATAPDGGALVVDYDFSEPFEVYESTIVGGFVLWSGSDPGFGLIEFEEPEEGVFPMVSDVEISFDDGLGQVLFLANPFGVAIQSRCTQSNPAKLSTESARSRM